MTRYLKLIIPFLVLIIVILYSLYQKQSIEQLSQQGPALNSQGTVLTNLPSFEVFTLNGEPVGSQTFKLNAKAFYVHIWGTWCGPCETEFGDVLKFAESVKGSGVNFYLLAVNDEVVNVNKFLKRYKTIPENVKVLIDRNNQVMDKFGTYKVPETFLFGADEMNKNKYVGPQEWTKPIYTTQLFQVTR